jgi:hypothetical protein
MKQTSKVLAIAVLSCLFVGPALAEEAAAPEMEVLDMATLSCRDMMIEDDEGKSAVLGYLLGYAAGKSGNTLLVGDVLMRTAEYMMNHCLDNSTENLIDAFEAMD